VLWIGTGWEPLPLARAVSLTQEYRTLFWGLEDDDLGLAIWPQTFLVLTRPDQPDVLTIDCDGDLPTSPVHHFFPEDAAATAFAHSIGELVARWLRAMEKRLTHFDRSQSKWTFDLDATDEAGQI
jgi:hypothetical protein